MATAIDPICHMEVDTDNPPGGQSDYQGTSYYFCAPGCRVAFEKEPEKYLAEDWAGMPHHHHDPAPQKLPFFSRLFGRKP